MASSQTFTLNIKALFDASDVKAKVGDIQNALKNLKLPDNLQKSFNSSFDSLNKALTDFETRAAKGVKTKADAKGLTSSMDNVIKEFTKVQAVVDKIRNEIGTSIDLSKAIKLDDASLARLKELKKNIENIQQQLSNVNAGKLDKLKAALNEIKSGSGASKQGAAALKLFEEGDVQGAIDSLTKIIEKLEVYKTTAENAGKNTANVKNSIEQLKNMRDLMVGAQNESASLIQQQNQAAAESAQILTNAEAQAVAQIESGAKALNGLGQYASSASAGVNNLVNNQARLNTELDQVKSRIQYFLGLSNAVNLFRRAIQSAFNTVKELDAAMTETAVVTDFTVSDMWKQLPEYTKRANELGVSTKAAYESATLYFQQGLNNDQAAQLSVETLKMARIAGLDAAEATDRMTNALRGFNMELNTVDAQRVDDVYSQLAAMSASNVDEISTAMTKVASLAHSANMEFESTAAFLAQIIETTRESAETAGTALKTVVARFSEVKKLVDTNELRGTDEEGQVVDVNKVSEALRTAGIDLNKYFLGEVGLDDIFMELASKWDSLTSVQQRYIATQAAGSRQQSRFIALMQDYARTQELVSAAYNANGASARQFEKTQESLESKLARLKNAWNEFLMGITNSGIIKGAVDTLTIILNIVNKLTSAFGSGASGVLKFATALAGIVGLRKAFASGGIAERVLGSLGNSKIGQWLGFGGNEITLAGAKVSGALETTAAEVTTAGAHLAAAIEGAAGGTTTASAVRAASQATGGAHLPPAVSPAVPQTLAQRLADYKNASAYIGKHTTNQPTLSNNLAVPKTLFGALGNNFIKTGIGSKIQGGLTAIPGIGTAFSGATAGAATLAATLGTVAVAAGVAAVAIKAAYDASPQGQLKIAERYAASMSDVAANAQKTATELKDVQRSITEYENAITNATTTTDKSAAIQSQNEYLLSLLEKDATYAQYIQSTFTEGGQLYLTLDSNALAAAVDKIAEGATRASAYSNFANAITQQQRADLYRARLNAAGVDLTNNTRTVGAGDYQITRALTSEEQAKYRRYQAEIDAANIGMRNYAATAAAQLVSLEDTKIGDDLAALIANAIGATFNADDIMTRAQQGKRANWWAGEATDAQIRAEYSRLYGADLEKGYNKGDAQYAIALGQVLEEEIEGQVPELLDIVRNSNGKMLLEVITGAYEGNVDNVDLASAFNSLTEEQKTTLESLIHADSNSILSILNKYADIIRKNQIEFRKKTTATLMKSGLTNERQLDRISNELTISQQKKLVDIADSLTDFGESFSGIMLDQVSQAMLDGTYDTDLTLQQFVNSISDNPILMLEQLKQAAQDTNPVLQRIVRSLGLIDEAGNFNIANFEPFSKENLVQYYLASEEYDALTEKVAEFIEENGNINAHNIEELAKESRSLQTLLDNDIISANGLANALNALQEGNITIFDLNKNVLDLLDSFDSVANSIQRAGQFIKDFDPGEDWGDAYDFIDSAIKTMTDLVENRELGNPQLRNYWKAFFTTDPSDLADWEAGIALLEKIQGNGGANFWTDIAGFHMDENGNIADMGLEDFADSEFNSYRDYIKSLAEGNGFTQFTDDFYDLMIRNAANHDYGWLKDIAAIEVKKIAEAYGEGLENGDLQFTKADIQAIADAYGIDAQELLDAYTDKFGLEHVDFSSLEDKVRQFQTSLSEAFASATGGDYHQKTRQEMLTALGADADGSFSIDALYAKIKQVVPEVADGSISAQDWVQEIIDKSPGGKITLPVDYEVTRKTGEDTFKTETIHAEVEVSNLQEYEAAVEQLQSTANSEVLGASLTSAFTDATTEAQSLVDLVTKLGEQNSVSSVTAAITVAKGEAEALNTALSAQIDKSLNIVPLQSTISIGGGGTTITLGISVAAKGGLVRSCASGSGSILTPGLALTGEEAPEIVWNKEKGYAYLAGKDGPEINNLQPGDKVFNGEQTRAILQRSGLKSFAKGTIGSYAGTIWKRDDTTSGGGGGGSGSGAKKESTWRNELDWLYDLMEDIAEYERQQTILQSKYDLALEDLSSTGRDLFKLTQKELVNLETQLKAQETAQTKRLQQMGELQTQVNAAGYGQYIQWNQKDQTLEIDWDAIEAIQEKDTYDEVTDWLDRMEEVQDQMDDANDAIWDIKEQIQELQNRYLEQYLDFQDKVMDAVVTSYQQTIDNLSELNDKINDTNSSILDSIQKEIDLERQIRDNTDTEKNIAEMESRLAYLQRDTTGANDVQIKQLEQQLQDARESYSDTLVDQAVDKLQQQNDTAAAQREKQIELMQAQLDYWQESGGLWDEVADLIATGFTSNGSIIQGSDLWEVLKNSDAWDAMSEAQKKNWANELILETNEVGAHLIQLSGGNAVDSQKVRDSIASERGVLTQNISAAAETVGASINSLIGQLGGTPEHSFTAEKTEGGYASGGLNSKTGFAMLHGTPSEPEYVLNARQTDAFLRLADVLPAAMSGNVDTTNNYAGNMTFQVDVNVGSIANDYDVDSLVARIKENLYDAASYRNANALSFLR